jgi:RimJ/RimL family protein N-acetyltransferase
MDTLLQTPRLTLLRLTDTSSLSSPHVHLFHENWSNPDVTGWSLHGPTHSLDESYEWMKEQLAPGIDSMFYSVFVRPCESDKQDDEKERRREKEDITGLGEHVGSISLRLQPTGPSIPLSPPPPPGGPPPRTENLRALGYAFFPSAQGKGYATEAGHALLNAYAAFVSSSSLSPHKDHGEEEGEAKRKTYIEAAVDEDNPGSIKVLVKLGFEKLGWKHEEKKVFLNGAWRGPGYWVYGLFV